MAPDCIVWLPERSGAVLLIAALGTLLGALLSGARTYRAMGAAILVGLSLVPLGSVNGLTFLYSVVGALSVATIMGFAVYIGWALGFTPAPSWHSVLLMAVLVASLGLALYPASLGLLPWDPYRMGFHGIWLPAMLIVIAVATASMSSVLVPLWIAAAAAAWQVNLFSSRNLWDYVIDPVVWIASLILLAVSAVSRIKHRRRAGAHSRTAAGKGTG
jgi:hypothetical protein